MEKAADSIKSLPICIIKDNIKTEKRDFIKSLFSYHKMIGKK